MSGWWRKGHQKKVSKHARHSNQYAGLSLDTERGIVKNGAIRISALGPLVGRHGINSRINLVYLVVYVFVQPENVKISKNRQ